MATPNALAKLTQINAPAKPARIRLTRRSPTYWRVTIDSPPINVMGPERVETAPSKCSWARKRPEQTSWRRSSFYESERDSGRRICNEHRIERSLQ